MPVHGALHKKTHGIKVGAFPSCPLWLTLSQAGGTPPTQCRQPAFRGQSFVSQINLQMDPADQQR